MSLLARFLYYLLAAACLLTARQASAQDDLHAAWYESDHPYVKIAVADDGVYAVSAGRLQQAGVPTGTVDPASFRLFENGKEIPIYYEEDVLYFVGRRNRGTDEAWAYQNDPSLQSSTFYSLYTDSTYYWLTWGRSPGLRYETETGTNPIAGTPALTAVRDTIHLEEDHYYFYGDSYQAGHPLYTRGEGYYWQRYTNAGTWTHTVPLPHLHPDGTPVRLRVRLNSESASPHHVRLALKTQTGGTADFVEVDAATWTGYAFRTLEAEIAPQDLPAADQVELRLTLEENADSGTPNHVLLDWIEASYERVLAPPEPGAQQRFTVAAPEPNTVTLTGYEAAAVHVFDPADLRRLVLPVEDGRAAFTTPQTLGTYWATPPDAYRTPAALLPDRPSNWAAPSNQADYVVLTTAALRSSAEALATYRHQQDGYTVAVVTVQDVFDQFDYGRPTPIAIRRFVRAAQQWQTPPRFLNIWADAPYPVHTELENRARPPWAVPSYGYAPSDGWFAMQNEGPNDWTESLAIGRVTLRSNAAGQLFLQKLQHYEATPPAAWPKRMLVLAGGTNPGQQAALQSYSENWATEAASTPTGMDTLYFFKRAESALDATFQDSLRVALQRGTGWLNYFGHSAANSWEIVTDPPRTFGNAGRLPFVVSLGCRTGSFAGGRFEGKDTPSYGEQLILGTSETDPTPTLNGAIGHFGASDSGTIGASGRLNDELIAQVFQDTLRIMGLAVQRAKANYARAGGNVKHSLQYGLLGDPATRLAIPDRPDLAIAPSDLTFAPATPIPADSQLTVTARIANQGLVPADSVAVELVHAAPSGATPTSSKRLPPFRLSTQATFPVPLNESLVGENRFTVRIDPEHVLAEAAEENNTATQSHTVFSSNLAITAPRPFGIVNEQQPTLRISLASADQVGLPVIFQLDTTDAFDSPALQTARVTAERIYADWQPLVPLEDDRTYVWRARLDAPTAADTWQRAAFTVRTDLDHGGWLQQDVLFEANQHSETLAYRDGHWRFTTYGVEVFATSERGSGSHKGVITINGVRVPGTYLGLGFGVVILDGNTGQIRASGSFCTYESPLHNDPRELCYNNLDGAAAVAALDSVLSLMQPGDHLFVRTRHLARSSGPELSDATRALFHPFLPASAPASVDTLTYRHLWLLHARKGQPEATTQQVVSPDQADVSEITHTTRIDLPFPSGQTTSPRIGPATAWHALGYKAAQPSPSSTLRLDVLVADTDSVLIADVQANPTALEQLDAAAHRYLRLRATLVDSSQATPPQVSHWYVTYDGVPDLALDPSTLTLSADTLQEGQPLHVAVAVHNLGPEPTGQAVVQLFRTDAQNRTTSVYADTLVLSADSSHAVAAALATDGLAGTNRLRLVVTQPDLPEPTTYNNVLLRTFHVHTDQTPPRYNIRIDGRALPNDPNPVSDLQSRELPFVSARPTIEIEVEDENPYRSLSDSSIVVVRFGSSTHLGTLPQVPLSDPSITFRPATAPEEPARVLFTPDLRGADSTYTLAVTVRDASGNAPAPNPDNSYQVHFRVQSQVRVESLYPYPNPMQAFTRFAFRLEGADPSQIDAFRIRIYTLSGRLIREFDLAPPAILPELNGGGGLRIDWNQLLWDTRDQDGDLVASGVYLYKVFLRAEGHAMTVNEDSPVEKLVVIR